jgi:hypothetical protein
VETNAYQRSYRARYRQIANVLATHGLLALAHLVGLGNLVNLERTVSAALDRWALAAGPSMSVWT